VTLISTILDVLLACLAYWKINTGIHVCGTKRKNRSEVVTGIRKYLRLLYPIGVTNQLGALGHIKTGGPPL